MAQTVPVSVVPGELCASSQPDPDGPGKYIARSATIGAAASTTIEIAAFCSDASSTSTEIVVRLCGPSG